MPNAPTDDELMALVQKNDARAFELLVKRHGSAVFGYCMRTLGGNQALSEDISQGVWLRVIRHSATYKATGSFKAWLMTVTRNETFTQLRKQGPLCREDEMAGTEEIPGTFDVEDALQGESVAGDVREAVEKLPEAQRIVLTLWIEEDASYDSIAAELGVSEGSVRGLLYRAKQELKKLLEKK